jgi:hypothetical protein
VGIGMEPGRGMLPVGKRIKAPARREQRRRRIRTSQELVRNLENCRDFSVKHKFLINLKP